MEAFSDAKYSMAADLDVEGLRTLVRRRAHQLEQAQAELSKVEEPYRDAMDEIRPYIEGHALEMEQSFHHANVEVKFRSGYTRKTYNAKKIQEITKGDSALRRRLKPALKVTEIPDKVTVEEVA